MSKTFFSTCHGCSACGGMVEWSAVCCPFCRRQVTLADRCQWAGATSTGVLTLGAFAFGSTLGLVFFQIPHAMLAMGIAVIVGFWSVFRSTPATPARVFETYDY